MIQLTELELFVTESFNDTVLDNNERQQLRALTESMTPEAVNFVRNKAFELAREYLLRSAQSTEQSACALKWLERTVKTITSDDTGNTPPARACFSPGDSCRRTLVDLCLRATTSLNICVFTISDDRLSDAIVEAHNRGVDVKIISDNDKSADRGSDIDYLQQQGVSVRMDESPYHMHHKFALIDHSILVNGSFNWTRSASTKNQENILVTYDRLLVDSFAQKFDQLWSQFGN